MRQMLVLLEYFVQSKMISKSKEDILFHQRESYEHFSMTPKTLVMRSVLSTQMHRDVYHQQQIKSFPSSKLIIVHNQFKNNC